MFIAYWSSQIIFSLFLCYSVSFGLHYFWYKVSGKSYLCSPECNVSFFLWLLLIQVLYHWFSEYWLKYIKMWFFVPIYSVWSLLTLLRLLASIYFYNQICNSSYYSLDISPILNLHMLDCLMLIHRSLEFCFCMYVSMHTRIFFLLFFLSFSLNFFGGPVSSSPFCSSVLCNHLLSPSSELRIFDF